MNKKQRMYANVKTWNPFVGCAFQCTYCKPSFQHLLKRIGAIHNCKKCSSFKPHEHSDRLISFPSKKYETIWACAHGDISFADAEFIKRVIEITNLHPERTYYWQSKNPICFKKIIPFLSKNSILLTTLETNRDNGYGEISKAPLPSIRYQSFKNLDWTRKIITIEPILDFDHHEFLSMIRSINPESVWIGYNSRPKRVILPEPALKKTKEFIYSLKKAGIEVREKLMRDSVR